MKPLRLKDLIDVLFYAVFAVIMLIFAVRFLRKWNAEDRLPYDRLSAIVSCAGAGALMIVVAAHVMRMLGNG